MFFSVIIPLYNKADVILRTLESVARQTFHDFELIVVDDGSTDSGGNVVLEFARNVTFPVKLIRQENAGVSAARNRGANESRGNFLAMLDGDDIWLPFHLEDLFEVYMQFPAAKVISTAFASGNRYKAGKANVLRYSVFDYPDGGYPICSDTLAVEREYFISIGGYNVRFRNFEDRELYYRMADDIGDFYANTRVSALYLHDAKEGAHVATSHGFAQCAYMSFAVERIKDGKASERMKQCVARSAFNYIRGDIVRGKWDSIEELNILYPEIARILPLVGSYDWHKNRSLIRALCIANWLWINLARMVNKSLRSR